jgi:hypothetical protein
MLLMHVPLAVIALVIDIQRLNSFLLLIMESMYIAKFGNGIQSLFPILPDAKLHLLVAVSCLSLPCCGLFIICCRNDTALASYIIHGYCGNGVAVGELLGGVVGL